ncbi:MAG: polysaccharide pyruvyl transferase family protein, partial [Devosia sp.]|nr:polysaccharide pyruvyl transferase family protein [Devosia sp.]
MVAPQRIGVLTFHRCINYGSFWQARQLVEGLRARGLDAVLLEHESARVNRLEWRCALQPLLPIKTSVADYPRYREKMGKFFAAFEQLPLSKRFALDAPETMEPFELVLVGSDEVWNLRHPWYGAVPLFYGDGLRADKLASYAASFGNYPAADGLDPFWAQKLEQFDAIAVRDENSRRLVRDALGIEPALVLDPCLQFPPKAEPMQTEAPYLAVYGHGLPGWFRDGVRQFALDRGLRLVSIGYRNDWADESWIEAGPEEFAQFIAGASAVATNFFHGCVFALLNNKPFAAALSDYRSNKVRDLLATVGAERHLASAETPEEHYFAMLGERLEPVVAERIG